MVVRRVILKNFRNHRNREFEFGSGVNVIWGDNGAGKTNILEAIYMLAVGKSFRALREIEMVAYDEHWCRVKSVGEEGKELEVFCHNEGGRWSKRYLVNGIAKRMVDFVGNLKVVLFGPWDMDLLVGSPAGRRSYLDMVLCQVDREYRRSLLSYEKGLRQRNRLLEMIREGEASRRQLAFWDSLLIKNGECITKMREEYLEFVGTVRVGEVEYEPVYDKSVVTEARLAMYEKEEVAAGRTLVGPHRDDFRVTVGGRDLASYGSRGEQRMVVLWLKMGEVAEIERRGWERPLVLLDDIFSELDVGHRRIVNEVVKRGQVVVTAAELELVRGLGGEIVELSGSGDGHDEHG